MRPHPFCLLPALALLLTLPAAARADDKGDIVLGMSAAFKGKSRGLGIELYRGAMAYFEEVNSKGGVNGRKIVIKAYDDEYQPTPCIQNTVRLIDQDKVFLLFGYVGTPTVTRTLPLLKRYSGEHVTMFFPFTGAEPQRQPPYEEYVFNLRASYRQETAALVEEFVKAGRRKIAVFYQIDAYGRNGWDGVRLALDKHKLKMVGEATYKRGTGFDASMKAQVEILRKAEPDAIISVGAYAACAAFVRDCRDAGWDVPIANVSFVGSESLLGLLKDLKGKDYMKNLINSQVVPSYHREDLPAVREYRQLVDKHNLMPPEAIRDADYKPLQYSFVGFEGFLDAKLLVEFLKKMGKDLDRKRIREVMESMTEVDLGIDAPVSFGPNKHQGLNQVYITEVEDGRFVRLKSWEKYRK